MLGQVLVAGNAFGNGAGAVGLSGPNTTLLRTIAQLYQVALGQTDERSFAFHSGIDNAGRAGAQAAQIGNFFQAIHRGGDVKALVVGCCHDNLARSQKALTSELFMFGAKHHFVDATLADLTGLAKFCPRASQQLQLDGDVLHDVSHPGAAHQAGQEASSVAHAAVMLHEARQPAIETVVETFNFVGGVVFHFTQVNQGLDDGAVGPDVGSAQVIHAQDLNVFEGHKLAKKWVGDTIEPTGAGVQQSPGSCFFLYRRPSIDID